MPLSRLDRDGGRIRSGLVVGRLCLVVVLIDQAAKREVVGLAPRERFRPNLLLRLKLLRRHVTRMAHCRTERHLGALMLVGRTTPVSSPAASAKPA